MKLVKEKWALDFIINEQPIPEVWREAFYDELTSEDEKYKRQLEAALREFGVRWKN